MNNLRNEANQYLDQLDCFDSSRKTISSILKNYVQWVEQHPGVKPEEYKKFLESRRLKPRTIRNYLTVIKNFYSWEDKKFEVKMPKIPKGHSREAVTIEDVRLMLRSFNGKKDIISLRNKAIIALLAVTSLRVNAICEARIEDVKPKEGKYVLYYRSKGRSDKDSYVVLPIKLYEILNEYIEVRFELHNGLPKEDQFLFLSESSNKKPSALSTRSISGIVKEALKGIGLNDPRFTCHSLRHGAVTSLIKLGGTMEQAMQLANHSSLLTTQLYYHDEERLEAGLEEKLAKAILS